MTHTTDPENNAATAPAPDAVAEPASTQDKVSAWLEPLDAVGTAALTDAGEGLVSAAGAVAEGIGGAVEVVASMLGGLLELGS